MFEVFRKYLADKITLTNQEFELIKSVSLIKKLRKRQYFLQEGNVCHFSAFVCKGFLRYYYIDKKGQEHIIQFAPENYWTGDRESMDSGTVFEEAAPPLLKAGSFSLGWGV